MSYGNLTTEQVLALPTHRLLKVYQNVRNGTFGGSSWYYDENAEPTEDETLRDLIKNELDTRPHVERDIPKNGPGKLSVPMYKADDGFWNWGTPPKKNPVGSITNPEEAIGKQVFKISKKPFKSKNVYNTVASVTVNPHTKLPAFTFEEDSSIVDVHICEMRKN